MRSRDRLKFGGCLRKCDVNAAFARFHAGPQKLQCGRCLAGARGSLKHVEVRCRHATAEDFVQSRNSGADNRGGFLFGHICLSLRCISQTDDQGALYPRMRRRRRYICPSQNINNDGLLQSRNALEQARLGSSACIRRFVRRSVSTLRGKNRIDCGTSRHGAPVFRPTRRSLMMPWTKFRIDL